MIFNARNAAFFAPELTLLVAAGEQEDLCPFFASRHHGALAFLVPKRLPYGTESSLGSDVLGGPPSGRLAGRFPPGRLLLPGGRGARPVPKSLPYGTESSLGSDVLGGPPSGRLAGRFPPGRLLLPGGRGARPANR